MKLTMLGTGNALVTRCYNTCFVLQDEKGSLLVDGGGGNQLLVQLEKAAIDWKDIHEIVITHKHIDHIMGIIWMIRMIAQNMKADHYEGEVFIYGHEEVICLLKEMALKLFNEKMTVFFDKRIHFVIVKDKEIRRLMGHDVIFFDIHSTKDQQFGFQMLYNDKHKLTCLGDEPYNETEAAYVKGSTWLLHEAFCLSSEEALYHPYEKHHSTVKDACELAQAMKIDHLLLYHTEDHHIKERKTLYTQEGQDYYHGHLYVPDDLESVIL